MNKKQYLNLDQILNITVDVSTPVGDAIRAMDVASMQVLLVTEKTTKLVGILTDGDLRRAVLKGLSLTQSIKTIIQTNFKRIDYTEFSENMFIGDNYGYTHMPVVKENNILAGLLISEIIEAPRSINSEKNDTPIIIMAGGIGSRLAPFTNILPKPLLPVGSQTILEKIIDTFRAQGFWNFFVILNYKSELIKAYFQEMALPYDLTFIEEPTFLGTAGGLRCLDKHLNDRFILSNADVVLDINYTEALDHHRRTKAKATIISVEKTSSISYGTIEFDKKNTVTAIIEKPRISHHIMSGLYILEKSALDYLHEHEPCGMDELLNNMIADNKNVQAYVGDGVLMDIGQFSEYRNFLQHFGVLSW